MVERLKHRFIVFPFFVLLLAVTACSALTAPPSTATPVPTVDTNAIVAAVLAEIEPQLAQPTATPVPTVDQDEITAAVLAELEPLLSRPTVTPIPTVDADGIAESIMAQVETQAALAAAAESIQGSLMSVYQGANPAVVFITVPLVGSGSGFVYSQDGHIVTNSHVVVGETDFEVVFANGERRRAALVGADADSDLAVIRVDRLPEGVEPLPLAPVDDLQVGQFVVAIGNPFEEQGSMSLGIVSGLGRSLRSLRGSLTGNTYTLPQVIQTDAPINPGNSGGPLLNLDGEVVGVNAAIASRTGTNSGVGFSIPVAAVRQIVPSLIENGAYAYPFIGAGFADGISLEEQAAFDLPQTNGAYVLGVERDSPAEEAGLIPADPDTGRGGDLIVTIDDREINSFSDLNSYLVFHTVVGQTIELTVLRDGEAVVLPLTLSARP
jgi:2-alkenal reductase